MFDNLGQKAKVISQIAFWIRVIICLVLGFVFYMLGKQLALNRITSSYSIYASIAAVIVIVVGPIVAWLKSALYYAAGQLLENSDMQTEIMKREYKEKKKERARSSLY